MIETKDLVQYGISILTILVVLYYNVVDRRSHRDKQVVSLGSTMEQIAENKRALANLEERHTILAGLMQRHFNDCSHASGEMVSDMKYLRKQVDQLTRRAENVQAQLTHIATGSHDQFFKSFPPTPKEDGG